MANGSIVVNGLGGTGTIEYSINNGAFQASGAFNNLATGNYTIKIKDANGCNISSVVNISSAPSPIISNVPITNILCNGDATGTIDIITNGGTNPLDYSLNGGTTQSSNSFNALTAGAYAILVTDANGCTAISNVNLTQPSPLAVSSNTISSLCSASNGEVSINANGATPGYQYSLSGGPYQGSNIFSGLLAGNYTVAVQDANGCITTTNFDINDIPSPVISTSTVVDALCFDSDDGSIDVTITGGTAPVSYSLNGGPSQPTSLFSGLTDGNYTVLVTDANGCTTSINLVVNEPTEIIMATVVTSSTCGNANGTLTINASGGTGTLIYSLDSGPFQTGKTLQFIIRKL